MADADVEQLLSGFAPEVRELARQARAPQRSHVNLMFAKGAELLAAGCDERGVLEGTGKRARHIKLRDPELLDDPAVGRLVEAAVARTPRA